MQGTSYLGGQVAEELDFYRLRQTVAALAASKEGKEELLCREPCADVQEIAALKALGREWAVLLHGGDAALRPWPPVREVFPLLGKEGATLSEEQFLALGQFCRAAEQARGTLCGEQEVPVPALSALASGIPPLEGALSKIRGLFDLDSAQVRDVPPLRSLRGRISQVRAEIDAAIRRYTVNPAYAAALQSTVPAYREDRELLAVRTDRQSMVRGIVHGLSASGQTAYIEPEEAVRAHNDLVQAEHALHAELQRLFRELTAALGEHREDLAAAHGIMLRLDATQAAARWQAAVGGVFAEPCDLAAEPPAIVQARHPLLGTAAVPVDIRFLDGKRVLVITGPNTGGKTVTLKTVALFALLNQAGFPVPAAEGTRLPVFGSVFADIGDEQSIDQSLSTFSGHMKKLSLMLREADSRSLILLDELGSGTDPQEGGAIALAALDELIARGAFVIVTTHHGILKNYGYTHVSCVNASVEFDGGTMAPTYRLLMGVPGESHAIDVARRSGLPPHVLQKAREYLSTEQADVSALITGLSAKHAELDGRLRAQAGQEELLAQTEVRLRGREVALRERELEVRRQEQVQEGRFLREARSRLENLVRELREGEITRQKTLAVRDFIADLTAQVEERGRELEAGQESLAAEKEAVRAETSRISKNGMRISSLQEHGTSSKKKSRRRLSNAEALAQAQVPPAPPQRHVRPAEGAARLPRLQDLLEPGAAVLAGSERRAGTLVQKNRNGTWTVLFGSLKMAVPQAQLVPVDIPRVPEKASVVVETAGGDGSADVPQFELRLLGMRGEEAIKALERQLDLCLMSRFLHFSIIHGKGNGVLQQAVHDYLSHYPGVQEFRFAPPEDGGTGKTYVTLR